MERAVAVFGFSLLAGSAAFAFFGLAAAFIALALVTVIGLLLFLLRRSRGNGIYFVALLALLVAAISFILHTELQVKPADSLVGQTMEVSGELIELPQPTNSGYEYIIKTSRVVFEGAPQKIKVVLFSTRLLDVEPYDILTCTVTMEAPYERYRISYYANGCYLKAYLDNPPAITPGTHKPPMYYALKLRQEMIRNTEANLPSGEAGVVSAIVLGDRSGLDPADYGNFKASGVIHMVAVSGMHMSVLSGFVFLLLRKLRAPKAAVSCVSSLFAIGFMMLTGFSPSVVRAGIMCIILYMSYWFWRGADSFNSLCIAGTVLVLWNPFFSLDLRFLLSFFATLGVVVMPRYLERTFFARRDGDTLLKRSFKSAGRAFTMTICATFPILPIIAVIFGGLSIISPVANLVIGPVCSILMPVGLLAGLLSATPLAAPFYLAAGLLARVMRFLAAFFGNLPFSTLSMDYQFVPVCIAALLFLAGVVVAMDGGRKLNRVGALVGVCLVLLGSVSYWAFNRNNVTVAVLDAGDGCGVLVTDKGRALLIGAGGTNTLEDLQYFLRGSELEMILLPKLNDYYAGSAFEVAENYGPESFAAGEAENAEDRMIYADLSLLRTAPATEEILWRAARITFFDTYTELEIYGRKLWIVDDGAELPQGNADVIVCGPACEGAALSVDQYVVVSGSMDAVEAADRFRGMGTTAFPTAGLGEIIWQFRPGGGQLLKRCG